MNVDLFAPKLRAAVAAIAAHEQKKTDAVDREFADLIGVAVQTFRNYKSGKHNILISEKEIELLARKSAKRGQFNRIWLRSFLRYSGYKGNIDRMLDDIATMPYKVEHPFDNMPSAPYHEFVMRKQPYSEIVKGLSQRSAAVVVTSLGGMGKTSLVHEIAYRCIAGYREVPQFDAIVWISDFHREGTTNLSVVLNTIAETLKARHLKLLRSDEKKLEVDNLLRAYKTLVVIDNFETIHDDTLLEWLIQLPEPSKALITSREYCREFRQNMYHIELRGMTDEEALGLIRMQLRNKNILKHMCDFEYFEALVEATGGNPKAIELATGHLNRHRIQDVIDDLHKAQGEVFDYIFRKNWSFMSEPEKRLLLAMPLFTVSASELALSASADLYGIAFQEVIESLANLSLVDVVRKRMSSPPRYAIHALVRSFAQSKEQELLDIHEQTRMRWVKWYVSLANEVGQPWDQLERLKKLDSEKHTIYEVMQWSLKNGYFEDVYKLARGTRYYYFVRGRWDRRLEVDEMHIQAAYKASNSIEEIKALSHYLYIACRRKELGDVQPEVNRLQQLISQNLDLPVVVDCLSKQALAIHEMVHHRFDSALAYWMESIRSPDERLNVAASRWSARCLVRIGNYSEARRLLQQSLETAKTKRYIRSQVLHYLDLTRIDLLEQNLDDAEQNLVTSNAFLSDFPCPTDEAELTYLNGWLFAERRQENRRLSRVNESCRCIPPPWHAPGKK